MNGYEKRQEQRRRHLLEKAQQVRASSDAVAMRVHEMAQASAGTPILVGHHSEKKHRRHLETMDRLTCKSYEGDCRAQELERRADAVGKGGISSDDPDAISKLEAQLAQLEADQAAMREVNKAIKQIVSADERWKVTESMLTAEQIERLLWLHSGLRQQGREFYGFRSYSLTNNSSNIRRIRARIEALRQSATATNVVKEAATYDYREDVDENRAIFEFQGKPEPNIRTKLRSCGFRWAPSRGVWMRQLTANARTVGRNLCTWLDGRETV